MDKRFLLSNQEVDRLMSVIRCEADMFYSDCARSEKIVLLSQMTKMCFNDMADILIFAFI